VDFVKNYEKVISDEEETEFQNTIDSNKGRSAFRKMKTEIEN